jgi:DNA/RNA-binding domain of Phe-tRNA-synthetase-like protein
METMPNLQAIEESLEIRFARAGDRFHPLDGEAPEDVPPGHLVYAIGPEVITLNFWRQSRIGLVDATSRDVLLASEVIGSNSDAWHRQWQQTLPMVPNAISARRSAPRY